MVLKVFAYSAPSFLPPENLPKYIPNTFWKHPKYKKKQRLKQNMQKFIVIRIVGDLHILVSKMLVFLRFSVSWRV